MRRVLFFITCLVASAAPLLATPTQEDVLRSISDSVDDQRGDSRRTYALLAAAVGVVLVLIVVSRQRQRQLVPKAFNHHGKLLKEIARELKLKPAEVRQLKMLAEQQQLDSPLTMLLCPSLLAKAATEAPQRLDRRIVAGILRKLSIESAT